MKTMKTFCRSKKALVALALVFMVAAASFSLVALSGTKAVALVIDGERDIVETTAFTVRGLLEEQEIEINPEDKVSEELHSFLADDQTIHIETAVEMTIIDAGETYQVMAQPGTVDEVLNATGHARDANDWVFPSYQSWADEGAVITVQRIDYKRAALKEPVAPRTVEKEDDSMPAGTINVLQEGSYGLDEVVYESMYKDGQKVKDVEISRTTLEEPQDKIIAIGTEVGNPEAVAPVSGDYSKVITVEATAYTHTGNLTATGTVARVGVIAVDPNVIPLGTRVYVEGYGYAVAEDTGGAIKGNIIDLFMDTNQECINWGRRDVKVYILD